MPNEPKSPFTTWSVPMTLSVFLDLVLLCHCALRNSLFINGTAGFYFSLLNSLLKSNLLFPPQKKMTCQKSAMSSMLFSSPMSWTISNLTKQIFWKHFLTWHQPSWFFQKFTALLASFAWSFSLQPLNSGVLQDSLWTSPSFILSLSTDNCQISIFNPAFSPELPIKYLNLNA